MTAIMSLSLMVGRQLQAPGQLLRIEDFAAQSPRLAAHAAD